MEPNIYNPISYEHLPTYAEIQQRNGAANDGADNNASSETNNNSHNNIDLTNPFNNYNNRGRDDDTNANQGKPATGNNSDNANAKHPSLDEIVNAKDFGEFSDDLIRKAVDGDSTEFKQGLTSLSRRIYKTAIQDANALMEAKLAKFKTDMESTMESRKKADSLIATMKSSLEFTKNPEIEPVATQVLAGYIRKGLSVDEALGATKQYFGNLAKSFNDSTNKPDSNQQNSRVLTGEDALNKLFS